MKKILVTTTLLSIVMCENILLENHPRSKELWVRNNQLWSRKMKRTPRNDLSFELKEFLNRIDDKQLSRVLRTQFISESKKSPIIIIRQPDSTQFSQDDLSLDKSKFNRIKPAVLISIGIQETKTGDNSRGDCTTKKSRHRKHNHDWQMQPFYVEEPKWVAIDPIDYIDGTSRRLDDADPYVLTRGKKILRLNDSEQVAKPLIENNEELFDYPSRSKRSSTKSRAKRSVGTNEDDFRKNAVDEKDNRKEKINHYGSFQSIDRDTKRKNENSHFTSDTNKRSTLLKSKQYPEIYKKHEAHKLNWMNAESKQGVGRNETDVLEQMMEKMYVDKLNDLRDAYDSFILSRGKHTLDSRTESSNKNYASHDETYEKSAWKNAYLEASDSKREKKDKIAILQIERNTTEKTDSHKMHKTPKISMGKNIDPNYREKRDACKSLNCELRPQLRDQLLLKSFEEEIRDTLSLERRDKTSEFLKKLAEPSFVISRGKKTQRSKFDPRSMFQSRNMKVIRLPIVRSLLRMLKRYNNSNDFDVYASKLASRRDRRDSLDDIFAKEEPFYVGRGRRMESDGFLMQPLQRENIISPETNAKQ